MPAVVTIQVEDPAEAGKYYATLLGAVPAKESPEVVTLCDEHVQVDLQKANAPSPSEISLDLTPGMLARILDMAMKSHCQITVESESQVAFVDRYGHRWILRCCLAA